MNIVFRGELLNFQGVFPKEFFSALEMDLPRVLFCGSRLRLLGLPWFARMLFFFLEKDQSFGDESGQMVHNISPTWISLIFFRGEFITYLLGGPGRYNLPRRMFPLNITKNSWVTFIFSQKRDVWTHSKKGGHTFWQTLKPRLDTFHIFPSFLEVESFPFLSMDCGSPKQHWAKMKMWTSKDMGDVYSSGHLANNITLNSSS